MQDGTCEVTLLGCGSVNGEILDISLSGARIALARQVKRDAWVLVPITIGEPEATVLLHGSGRPLIGRAF